MNYITSLLADTYNSSAYGASTYQTGSSTVNAGSSGSGVLSNTGVDILAAVTMACVIIFAALIIRFWKRPSTADKENEQA